MKQGEVRKYRIVIICREGTLEVVNAAREKAGLYLLSEAENKKTVTNTRKSRHFNGEAVDIAPVKK